MRLPGPISFISIYSFRKKIGQIIGSHPNHCSYLPAPPPAENPGSATDNNVARATLFAFHFAVLLWTKCFWDYNKKAFQSKTKCPLINRSGVGVQQVLSNGIRPVGQTHRLKALPPRKLRMRMVIKWAVMVSAGGSWVTAHRFELHFPKNHFVKSV